MILWGNIGEFPLFTVLQFLASQRRTGILEIQDFEEYGAIYMSRGRIEAISLPQADEELGQRLVVAGAMTETQVKECWMNWSNNETGLPLLAHLLETARSEHAALVKIVDRHTADQVMQLMYWSAGTFRFTIPTEVMRFPVVPSIDVENLLLEAYRRVDEGERPRHEKVSVEEELCMSCSLECTPKIKARYLKPDVCLWRAMPSILKDSRFHGRRKKHAVEDDDPGDLAFI